MDLERIIRDQGFELARQRKHKVYKHPDGRTFVMASTPSDWRAGQNILGDFAKVTGKSRQELLNPAKPERERTRLEPIEEPMMLVPVAMAEVPPLHVDTTTPLTKNDLKKLKRWEKHYAEREARHAKLKQHLELMMDFMKHESEVGKLPPDSIMIALEHFLSKEGRNPILVGFCITTKVSVPHLTIQDIYGTLQVGPFYLDLYETKARTETTWWYGGKVKVEILGAL